MPKGRKVQSPSENSVGRVAVEKMRVNRRKAIEEIRYALQVLNVNNGTSSTEVKLAREFLVNALTDLGAKSIEEKVPVGA